MLSPLSKLTLQQPQVDLLDMLNLLSRHPSIRTSPAEDSYATSSSSRNWKTFIVGLIGPDNPVTFVPVARLKREIPLAETPPQIPKPKPRVTKAKKDQPTGVVQMQGRSISMEAFRQALYDAWTRNNGGTPPTEAQLALMLSQACIESGGLNWEQKTFNPTKSAPNFNFSSHETGRAPNTYEATWDVERALITYNGKTEPIDGLTAQRGGKLYYAPRSENGGFYKIVENSAQKYIATDRDSSSGNVELRTFQSFNSIDESANTYAAYILSNFPGVKNASTAEEWNHAVQYGIEIPNSPYKHASFHARDAKTNEDYVRGLNAGLEAYQKKWGPASGSAGTTADRSDDPTGQHIMTYGSSTDPDDPLGPVFGRNIERDQTRMEALAADLDGLQASISAMNCIPPLVLLVNPQEFKRSHENAMDFGVKTRVGNIVHTWLEQPIKITSSGVSAAQYAVDADMAGGLTAYNRIHSLSYRNLMSLVLMYKNNGMVYDGSGKQDGSILLPGSVFIAFDDHVYIGSFDNFSVTDSADKPFNLSYSFTFTVRYDMHVDLGVDAQLASLLTGA